MYHIAKILSHFDCLFSSNRALCVVDWVVTVYIKKSCVDRTNVLSTTVMLIHYGYDRRSTDTTTLSNVKNLLLRAIVSTCYSLLKSYACVRESLL